MTDTGCSRKKTASRTQI